MPRIPEGAKTTDLAPMANDARQSGFLSRVGQAVRYAIAGVTPQTWMSPNQPVDPVAQEAMGRRLDYPVGYNLVYTPRNTELTSFQQLRALADNCDLVRLAIETRKDQLTRLAWDVQPVVGKGKGSDARADAVIAAFKKPDGRNTWQAWVRMLVEEVLVTDAPAIYPRKLNNGTPYAFELIDGALIKVLADADGRTPSPPSPAYQQIIKGLPTVDYTAEELVYMPRNPRVHKFYGYSPVEQILLTVNTALRRVVSQLQYFTEGNIPASFASVPKEWSPQQIEQFQKYWDAVIEGDQAYKRKVRFVPGDTKVTNVRDAPLKDDFDDWLARVITYAFGLPSTQFNKQATRTTSDTLQEAAEEEGLAPLKAWVKDVMDHLIQNVQGVEGYEFVWVTEDSLDPQSQATILTDYLKVGVMTVNEVRGKLGEDPVEGGDVPMIYTATGATPLSMVQQQADAAVQRALNPPQPNDPNAKPGEPAKVGEQPPPDEKKKPVAKRLAHSHAPDTSVMTPQMQALKQAFVVALGEVRDSVVKAAKKLKKASDNTDALDDRSAYTRDAEEIAAWEGFVDRLDLSGLSLAYDDLTDALVATAEDGSRYTIARLVVDDPELDVSRDNGMDAEVQWAKDHAADLIAKDGSGGELIDSTREMIRQTVAKTIADGETDAAIAKALQDAYAFSDERAELIARTEVRNALGNGGFIAAKAVGMEEKRWLLSNDEGICPVCEANAAQQWIPIGETFLSGDEAPLAHPRCRCDAAYRRKPKED